MPNKNFEKFPSKGAPTGRAGSRSDSVTPEKTKSWPDIPGKTQPKDRSFGFRRVKGAAASKGC